MNLKETLQTYINEGWVITQRHPTLPLNIYNYSQACQFDKHWDEITLQCRGLVLDDEGNVCARPFKKFFNWEEIIYSMPAEQWTMNFEVFDKMDGSLGVGFWYKDDFIIATRGSFASDQAVKAKEIMKQYRSLYLKDVCLSMRGTVPLTLLFEIIYPANRIVVDYGDKEMLVLLGAIETESGKELSYEDVRAIGDILKMPVVKKYDALKDFEQIKALNWDNMEGVVVRFENEIRMKIKFADYVALHRILTNCSSYDIWENLMTFGELPKELFDKVPDEFFGWVREVRDDIVNNYNFIEAAARAEFKVVTNALEGTPENEYAKAFALKVVNHRLKGLLFSLKNGQDISKAIWKLVKPDYSKPFTEKG